MPRRSDHELHCAIKAMEAVRSKAMQEGDVEHVNICNATIGALWWAKGTCPEYLNKGFDDLLRSYANHEDN